LSSALTTLSEKPPVDESAGRIPLPGSELAAGRALKGPPRGWLVNATQCAGSETACGSTGIPVQTLPGTLRATDPQFDIARRQFRAIRVWFGICFALSFRSRFPLCLSRGPPGEPAAF